jgi:hypothetical protein
MYLKTQIGDKRASKLNKMNDEEFKLNQKILQKIREEGEYINLKDNLNLNIDNTNNYHNEEILNYN